MMACLVNLENENEKKARLKRNAEHYKRIYSLESLTEDTEDERLIERPRFNTRSRSYDNLLVRKNRLSERDGYSSGMLSPRSDIYPCGEPGFYRRPLLCDNCGKLLECERGSRDTVNRTNSIELFLSPPESPPKSPINLPRYVTVAFSPEPTSGNYFDLWSADDQERIERLIKANSRSDVSEEESYSSYRELSLSLPDMTLTKTNKRHFKEVTVDIDAPSLLKTVDSEDDTMGYPEEVTSPSNSVPIYPLDSVALHKGASLKSPVLEKKYLIPVEGETKPNDRDDGKQDAEEESNIADESTATRESLVRLPLSSSTSTDNSFDDQIADLNVSGVAPFNTEVDISLLSPATDDSGLGISCDQTLTEEDNLLDTYLKKSSVPSKARAPPAVVECEEIQPVEVRNVEEAPSYLNDEDALEVAVQKKEIDVVLPMEEVKDEEEFSQEELHQQKETNKEESDISTISSISEDEDNMEIFFEEWNEDIRKERVMVNVIVDMPDTESDDEDEDEDKDVTKKRKKLKKKKLHKERVKVNLIVDLHDPRNVFDGSTTEEEEEVVTMKLPTPSTPEDVRLLKPLQTIPLFYQEEENVSPNRQVAIIEEQPPQPPHSPVRATEILATRVSSEYIPVHASAFFGQEQIVVEQFETSVKENIDVVATDADTHSLYAAVISTQEPCVEMEDSKVLTVEEDETPVTDEVQPNVEEKPAPLKLELEQQQEEPLAPEVDEKDGDFNLVDGEQAPSSSESNGISIAFFNVDPQFDVGKATPSPPTSPVPTTDDLDVDSLSSYEPPLTPILEQKEEVSTTTSATDDVTDTLSEHQVEDISEDTLEDLPMDITSVVKPTVDILEEVVEPASFEEVLMSSPSTDFFTPDETPKEELPQVEPVTTPEKIETVEVSNTGPVKVDLVDTPVSFEDILPDSPVTDFTKGDKDIALNDTIPQIDAPEVDISTSVEPVKSSITITSTEQVTLIKTIVVEAQPVEKLVEDTVVLGEPLVESEVPSEKTENGEPSVAGKLLETVVIEAQPVEKLVEDTVVLGEPLVQKEVPTKILESTESSIEVGLVEAVVIEAQTVQKPVEDTISLGEPLVEGKPPIIEVEKKPSPVFKDEPGQEEPIQAQIPVAESSIDLDEPKIGRIIYSEASEEADSDSVPEMIETIIEEEVMTVVSTEEECQVVVTTSKVDVPASPVDAVDGV